VGVIALAACAAPTNDFDRPYVSGSLAERSGHSLAEGLDALPPGACLEDGVGEDEAVAIALWRNAAFQEALAELGLRRADLVEAGLLPNPVFSLLFPLGPKQLEFWAKLPLEAIWRRPSRVAAAEADAERAATLLVERGLDLARDVRLTFAEWELAARRAKLLAQIAAIRERLDDLADARLHAGEGSEAETAVSEAELLASRAEVSRSLLLRDIASGRLRALLGLAEGALAFELVEEPRVAQELPAGVESHLQEALASRPDVRAAELAIEAAGERAGLPRNDSLALTAILDANGSGVDGFEAGPGVEFPIPMLNQGGGARMRAEADVERAARHYVAVRERVAHEVREAERLYFGAVAARREIEQAIGIYRAAHALALSAEQAGDTSLQPVLVTELVLVQAQARSADADVEVRRARAQLERAVGRRLP